MKRFIWASVSAVAMIGIAVGVAYAAGTNTDWLKIGGTGNAANDTLEFANSDATIQFDSNGFITGTAGIKMTDTDFITLFAEDGSGVPQAGLDLQVEETAGDPPLAVLGANEGTVIAGSLRSPNGVDFAPVAGMYTQAEEVDMGQTVHTGQTFVGVFDFVGGSFPAYLRTTNTPNGGEASLANDADAEVRLETDGDVVIVLGG